MRCDEIRPDLSALIDGELALHGRAAFEGHVASCGECARILADLERVRGFIDARIDGASAGRADVVMREIVQHARPRGRILAWTRTRGVRVAAMVLVVAAVAGVVLLRGRMTTPKEVVICPHRPYRQGSQDEYLAYGRRSNLADDGRFGSH
jgi:anti-sigma factor RsiW